MKKARIEFVKRLSVLAVVPDDFDAADLEGVCEALCAKGERFENWNPDDWEVGFVTPPVTTRVFPQDDDVVALSDDQEDLVHPHDAKWWRSEKEPA